MPDNKRDQKSSDLPPSTATDYSEPTRWEKLTICLQVLYMLRVPVLLGAAIFGFPLIAQFLAPTLLAGLYDFSENAFLGAFWYSLFIFLFAWAVMMCIKLSLNYGPQRMGLPDDDARIWFRRKRQQAHEWRIVFIVVTLLSAFALSGVFWIKCGTLSAGMRWSLLGGIILGFLLAFFLLFLADVIHSAFYKPANTKSLKFMLFPLDLHLFDWLRSKSLNEFRTVKALLKWLPDDDLWIISLPLRLLRRFKTWFKKNPVLSRGYFAVVTREESGAPIGISGHVTAIVLSSVFVAIYFIFGFGDRLVPSSYFENLSGYQATNYQRLIGVPAIVYVPILCTGLCWLLSSLSFFLDSYRIPVLAPVLLLMVGMSRFQEHYYATPPVLPKPVGFAQQQIPPDKEDFIIVVAADGGGIQAAAWAAQVLTGIEEECQKEFKGYSCAERIKLVSGVSGGSVGAMYFVDGFENGVPAGDELEKIRKRAASSSLRSVAWGLAYPDFLNTFIPVFAGQDRGRELEKDWGRNLLAGGSQDQKADQTIDIKRLDRNLSEWAQQARENKRPDVIFNATMVETGGRVMITTSNLLNKPIYKATDTRYTYHDLYPDHNISVASAARLSASFPFVTPVARGRFDGASYNGFETAHLADGGYYDNYGVASLLDWLKARLQEKERPKKVLVVQIRSGDLAAAQQKEAGVNETGRLKMDDSSQGGFFQLIAPLVTVLNVRTSGQRERADTEMEQFAEIMRSKENPADRVDVQTVIFNFSEGVKNPEAPPLSWHLTPKEKQDIADSWERAKEKGRAWEGFKDILTRFRAGM